VIEIKIKPLIPSLREKKRYLVYEITSPKKIKKLEAEQIIKTATKNFLGEFGLAKAGILFLDYKNNKGILRINNKEVNKVRSALTLVNNKKIIKTIYISGLLNKAKEKIGG